MRLAFALLAALASPAAASCGLDACPVALGLPEGPRWSAGTEFRAAGFEVAGAKGSYLELRPRAEYLGLRDWVLGGFASVLLVDSGGASRTGAGNTVLFGEFRPVGAPFAAGLQVELPSGDDERGLASGHAEALPYAAWRSPVGQRWHAMLRGGLRWALSGGHGHGAAAQPAAPLLVNPHADKELLARASLSRLWGAGGLRLSAELDHQQALEGGGGFLSAGAGADLPLGGFRLRAFAELPVTRPARFDWRTGLGLTTSF